VKTHIQDFLIGMISVIIGIILGIAILLLGVISVDNWHKLTQQWVFLRRWILNK
jgi:hypothetical protein